MQCDSCGKVQTEDQNADEMGCISIDVQWWAIVCASCYEEIDPDLWVATEQWDTPGRFRKSTQLEPYDRGGST